MQLSVDFYSKEEVAIRVDFTGRYPFTENIRSELFLFICFTLRQLSNLGGHPVARVLALLLLGLTKQGATQLAASTYTFPSPIVIRYLMRYQGIPLNFDLDSFQRVILSTIPRPVPYKGPGKKAFYVRVPPFHLSAKGFGILGWQVTFYAFHSVFALLSHFAAIHANDEVYLNHIANVAQLCGRSYFQGDLSILADQVGLANEILEAEGLG